MVEGRVVESGTERWEVIRPLGQGGMGQTLLVRSMSTGEKAVLKQLHVAHLENWKVLELFEREAELLQALDHRGIPAYLDRIDTENGVKGLVQSFVDGESLEERMRRAPLRVEGLERALRDCLEILIYLQSHTPPVVHRDITPANVMIDEERAYLIDFGSVKWALRESTVQTSVGTFGYMAPEQVRGQAEAASDIYALGMTFAAAAAGTAASQFAVDPATGQVDLRATLDGKLPERLLALLEAMTRPGLGQRLSDPREAIQLLDRAPGEASSRSEQSQCGDATPGTWLWVIGAVAVLGFFVVAGVIGHSDSADGDAGASATRDVAEAAKEVLVEENGEAMAAEALEERPEVKERASPAPPVVAEPAVIGRTAVHLRSKPPGAEVELEGEHLCVTPCRAEVQLGRQLFSFVLDGRRINRSLMVIQETSLQVSF